MRDGRFSCFLFFFYLKTISKAFIINLNFGFWSKPLITINQMQWHVCSNIVANLMINFSLMKKFIFLCFHEHKNTKSNLFNPISKVANFGCYSRAGPDKQILD
jgi:hypothetical protein